MQRGRHEDLLAEGGLYAELYRTQFAGPVRTAPESDARFRSDRRVAPRPRLASRSQGTGSQAAQRPAVDRHHRSRSGRTRPGRARRRRSGRTPPAGRSGAAGSRPRTWPGPRPGRRTASPGAAPARSPPGRAAARPPGCRPGPSSSASCLTSMARPGRSPLDAARPGIGALTEVDSTQATARSVGGAVPDHGVGQPQRGQEHGVERLPPLLGRGAEHRAGRRAADADQRAVQPPERSRAWRAAASAVSGSARSAATATARSLAQGGDRLVQHLRPAGDQHHPGALGDELLGGRPAQAAAGGGDDEDAVGQPRSMGDPGSRPVGRWGFGLPPALGRRDG